MTSSEPPMLPVPAARTPAVNARLFMRKRAMAVLLTLTGVVPAMRGGIRRALDALSSAAQ